MRITRQDSPLICVLTTNDITGKDMPFFIYGNDAQTGVVAKRIYTDAANAADARAFAASMNIAVTYVVSCAAQKPADPAAPPAPAPVRRAKPGSALYKKVFEEEHATFTRTLETLTPNAYVTYAVIAVNVLVFIVMVISGASAVSPSASDLIRWGGDFGMYTAHGEWWRLVTSTFIHIGFLHLFFNMMAFVYVGPTVERMFGSVGFLVLYLVSGIGGGLLALYLDPMQLHAGASGAIFGVYGALLAVLVREHDSVPPEVLAKLKRYVLMFIAYNLANSFQPSISMSAHVGGLLTGLVCGLIAARPLTADGAEARGGRNLFVAGAGLLLFAIGVHGMHSKYPNLDHMKDYLEHFDAVEEKTHATFKSASTRNQQQQLSNAQFADSIDQEILPPWRNERTEFETLPAVKSHYIDIRLLYLRVRQESLEAMSAALRGNDAGKFSDAREKTAKADKISPWTK
jgi:rhomboid protease GluP